MKKSTATLFAYAAVFAALCTMVFGCVPASAPEGASGAKPESVYLSEGGEYVEYLIVSRDYGGGILLLRRELMPELMPISDHFAGYDSSSIDKYLSGEFIELFPKETQEKMMYAEVETASDEALYTLGEQTHIIKRRAFLLSYREVSYSKLYMAPDEGEPLSCFTSDASRIAYRGGSPCSWWLRTPYTNYDSVTWCVGGDGVKTDVSSNINNGIRPAICFSGDVRFVQSTEAVPGKSVLVIE